MTLAPKLVDPEAAQLELDRLEGFDADGVRAAAHRDDRPRTVPQPEHLQRAPLGVDEPRVRDARFGVDPKLAAPVDALRGRGEDFAKCGPEVLREEGGPR